MPERIGYSDLKNPTDFNFPSVEEINNLELDRLREIAETNDSLFLQIMEKGPIPFFGFHGASNRAINHIKALETDTTEDRSLMVTTFFERPEDKKVLLNSLYVGAMYAASYAFKKMNRQDFDSPGAVAIINLQTESGINVAVPESEIRKKDFVDTEVIAREASVHIGKHQYQSRIVGFVGGKDHEQYNNIKSISLGEFSLKDFVDPVGPVPLMDEKILILEKISSQRIVYEAFKTLKLT